MSVDQIRVYLSRVVPWVAGAYVNVHYTNPNKNFDASQPEGKQNKRKFLNGKPFTTLDDAARFISWLQTKADTIDTYICLSAQAKVDVRVAKTGTRAGSEYQTALRSQENVVGLRSLFLDMDVKPGDDSAYPSTAEMLKAFGAFLVATGLPTPTLAVSSGTGGAHVYWVMDRTLPLEEWQVLANALAEATRRHGLKCDTQCTVNGAQILRPPGTLNKKRVPVANVSLNLHAVQPDDFEVSKLRGILTPYIGATVHAFPGAKATLGARPPVSGLNADLAGGITVGAPAIDLDAASGQCAFLAEAISTGGASFGQPLWNVATLVATFGMGSDGSDGRAQAHRMAKGHKGYTAAETDALYDRKEAERAARDIGWPSCRAVANAGCKGCATCPLAAMGKSPLSYGKPYAAPVTTLPTAQPAPAAPGAMPQPTTVRTRPLPDGYQYNNAGLVCVLVTNPDNTHTLRPVAHYPMHSAWLQTNPWVLHFVTRLGNSKHEVSINVPLNVLTTRDFHKALAGQGFMLLREQQQATQSFLMAWITTLQHLKDAVVSSSPFGWSTQNSKIEGFVYNGRLWGNGFDKPAATSDTVTFENYKPAGDLQPWVDAAKFISDQKRPALDAILAGSFGAPLMRFTGQSGVIQSVYSPETGIGKSTAMEVAMAIWGHPKKAMNGLEDTQNSAINKIGQLRSLPLLWDELKGDDQKSRFVKLAFQISGGKEKSRLDSNSNQREAGTWQTMVIAASNDSLVDSIQRYIKTNEAGTVRVFEYRVPASAAVGTDTHGYVSRLIAKTYENYGNAGLLYAKFLGREHDRIATEVAAMQDSLATRLQATNDERFWIAAMTVIFAGAKYANELGLTTIDEARLLHFLVNALKALRKQRSVAALDISSPMSITSVFASFLGEYKSRNTLTTDRVPVGAGRPSIGSCQPMGNHDRLEVVHVRHALEQKVFQFSDHEFREWCARRQFSPHALLEQMIKQWGLVKVTRSLGAGTTHQGMKQYCWEFTYAGQQFDALHDFEAPVSQGTP